MTSHEPYFPARRSLRRAGNESVAFQRHRYPRSLHDSCPEPRPVRCASRADGFTSQIQQDITLQLGSQVELTFTLARGLDRAAGCGRRFAAGDRPRPDGGRHGRVAAADRQPADQRTQLHLVLDYHAGRDDATTRRSRAPRRPPGLTFAGQRARSNNITVDGLDNNDSTLGSVRATFSQEAVREFQV